MSALDELRKELTAAEAKAKDADAVYDLADRSNRDAQDRATRTYDDRAKAYRNVDRYKAAITALESEDY